MNRRAGFTLVEMLIVLVISLMLMALVVPVFQVTTKTVQTIERKLSVYEAARNILEIIEADVKLAVTNERGGHWSIKSLAFQSTDPFMPPGTALIPGAADKASLAYRQSRRFADALDYARLEPAGLRMDEDTWGGKALSAFPGGKVFPLSYMGLSNENPGCWRSSVRSSLLYQTYLESYSSDYEMDKSGNRWNRTEQLADVGVIETSFIYSALIDQFRYWNKGGTYTVRHYDMVPDLLGPGKEIKIPPGFTGDIGSMGQRRVTGIRLMDLDISYWDDVQQAFVDPPDNTVVYFWPPPKAVRITITVCDREKRSTVTLSRIAYIPIAPGGNTKGPAGTGAQILNSQDNVYQSFPTAISPAAPAIGAYNRTKYMPNLPAVYDGYASSAWGGNYNSTSESVEVNANLPKPIGWP